MPWRQAPEDNWQKPASRVIPTPFFLAAQRRTASAVKKKLPKQKGLGPSDIPELPGIELSPVERSLILLSDC